MIGTTVGGYKIVSKLSTGGMGTIYRAEHVLIGKAAAVKILHPELSHNTEIVNRFFNEAKATTSIKHAGIVEVFDFGYLESGDAYLTMEFLEGVNLAKWLEQRGKRPEGEAAMLLRSVCNALAVAHGKGIIHRDLKPDNIFMVPDAESALGERPKILDFGIAKLSEIGAATTATRTGAVMGTPTYMSPEQCKGAGVVDARADLYSIGCILYELVCGKPPFTNMGAGEIIAAHLFMPPPRPREHTPELSDTCEGLILALLDKDPNNRPQSARELSARLTELAQQQHWVTPGAPDGMTSPALVPFVRPTPFPRATPAGDSGPMPRPSSAAPTPVRTGDRSSRTAMGRAQTEPPDAADAPPPKPTTLSGAASQRFDVPDAPPRSRKGLAIVAAAGALLLGGIVAFSVVGSGSSPRPAKGPVAPAAPEPMAAEPTPEPTPTPTAESPTPTPTPTPTAASPTPTPTPTPTAASPTPEPTPTPTAAAPTPKPPLKHLSPDQMNALTTKRAKKLQPPKPTRPFSTQPPKPKKPKLIETEL